MESQGHCSLSLRERFGLFIPAADQLHADIIRQREDKGPFATNFYQMISSHLQFPFHAGAMMTGNDDITPDSVVIPACRLPFSSQLSFNANFVQFDHPLSWNRGGRTVGQNRRLY